MSLATEDLTTLALNDIKGCLDSDVELIDVPVIVEDESNPTYGESVALACLTPKTGRTKFGIAVIVCQPSSKDSKPNMQYGPFVFSFRLWVIESRMQNSDTANGGTGIGSFNLARHVATLMKAYMAGGLILNFTDFQIRPLNMELEFEDKSRSVFKGWAVEFNGPEGDTNTYTRVLPVIISPSSGAVTQTVTLSCATAGAAIYYTTDLSHPYSGGATSTLYTVPLTISSASVVSARAFKSGSIGSIRTAARFT